MLTDFVTVSMRGLAMIAAMVSRTIIGTVDVLVIITAAVTIVTVSINV